MIWPRGYPKTILKIFLNFYPFSDHHLPPLQLLSYTISIPPEYEVLNSVSIEERALTLLGSGISAEQTAAALGVEPSRISQLLSTESFSDRVSALRYEALQKHNARDASYDAIEDSLLEKLSKSIPFLIKPRDILHAITVINGAKRRGQSAPEQINNKQTIVNLVLPTQIAATFTVNSNNQVVKAGNQELVTMQSGTLLKQLEKQNDAKQVEWQEEEIVREHTA